MFYIFGLDRLFPILVSFFRGENSHRKPIGIIAACLFVVDAVLLGLVFARSSPDGPSPAIGLPALIFTLASGFIAVAALTSYTTWPNIERPRTIRSSPDAELAKLAEARKQIEQELRQSPGPDLYGNLELNLNQLSEYYAINKSHARNSFRIGASSVVLGFAAILGGIGLIYFKSEGSSLSVTLLAGVAGLIGQFIGGYCFYLYNQASRHVATYYARLSQVQDTMLAVTLCELMKDKDQKAAITGQIISALLARSGQTAGIVGTSTSDELAEAVK